MDRDRLVEVLSSLPTALLDDFELEAVMGELGEDIAGILGVRGAGVMLEDEHGQLRFVAASDPLLRELERLQVEFDEGPCLLAYRTGEPVHAPDLADGTDFPAFARHAVAAGLGSVFSYPLHYDGGVIGALNLYDTEARELDEEADDAGATLAQVATGYLLHARDLSRFRVQNQQLARALDRRVLVEQAKGYLRAAIGVSADEAWELIRSYARSQQEAAVEVSRAVLDGHLGPEDLGVRRDSA